MNNKNESHTKYLDAIVVVVAAALIICSTISFVSNYGLPRWVAWLMWRPYDIMTTSFAALTLWDLVVLAFILCLAVFILKLPFFIYRIARRSKEKNE